MKKYVLNYFLMSFLVFAGFASAETHTFCLYAKGGYETCRSFGESTTTCLTADKGFGDCHRDVGQVDDCLSAKSGYQQCKNDRHTSEFCFDANADEGYGACVRGD